MTPAAAVKLALRRVATGILLPVRLTPKSSRDEIGGIEAFGGEAVLRARVRALPEAGRANQQDYDDGSSFHTYGSHSFLLL